jgi:hypothetical protein
MWTASPLLADLLSPERARPHPIALLLDLDRQPRMVMVKILGSVCLSVCLAHFYCPIVQYSLRNRKEGRLDTICDTKESLIR